MNNSESNTVKLLKEALKKASDQGFLAKSKNEYANVQRWKNKEDYLNEQIKRFTRLQQGTALTKSVFISFTKKNGTNYFEIIEKKLRESGFTVVTGFESDQEAASVLLKNVLRRIDSATLYLGIFTKEVKIDSTDFWSPSVWTIEEKGMALGLNKPVLLAADSHVHEQFFGKTTGDITHERFNNLDHFRYEVADKTVQSLDAIYTNLFKIMGTEIESVY